MKNIVLLYSFYKVLYFAYLRYLFIMTISLFFPLIFRGGGYGKRWSDTYFKNKPRPVIIPLFSDVRNYDKLLFTGRNLQSFNFSSKNVTDLYGLFHIETYPRGNEIWKQFAREHHIPSAEIGNLHTGENEVDRTHLGIQEILRPLTASSNCCLGWKLHKELLIVNSWKMIEGFSIDCRK